MAREITGRHVLLITLTAFGVIIGVNVAMAVLAIGTFPGLEVRNSYVASQTFDQDRAAQQALHWTVTPEYDGREMVLKIVDETGAPAQIRDLQVTIGRPTHVREDQTPDFVYSGGVFRAPVTLAPGRWNVHVVATSADGVVFRQRIDHYNGSQVN